MDKCNNLLNFSPESYVLFCFYLRARGTKLMDSQQPWSYWVDDGPLFKDPDLHLLHYKYSSCFHFCIMWCQTALSHDFPNTFPQHGPFESALDVTVNSFAVCVMHWRSSGKVTVSIRGEIVWDVFRVELTLACTLVCMLTFCWVMRFCRSQSTATEWGYGPEGLVGNCYYSSGRAWWIYSLCWLANLLREEVKLPRVNWRDFIYLFLIVWLHLWGVRRFCAHMP